MTIHHAQAKFSPDRPSTVASLRYEIDRIDDALLDLVEARVSLTVAMAALKDTDTAPRLKLRPRREAEVLGRLTGRARGADPAMIDQIWRTLMAYGLQDQAPMQLVLYADVGEAARLALQDRIRARFGPAAALRWAGTEAEALDAARGTETVAIVAGRSTPDLARTGDDMTAELRVFETLDGPDGTAYAIGRVAAEDLVSPEPPR